jgi:HEAT repeat protein
MTDWREYAAYYIERLGGPDRDNAYHSLIEADNAIIPILIDAFHSEQNPSIRSQLVEVIWQHRLAETIQFLSQVLGDPAPEVWKSALDGLVAIGGQSVIHILEDAKQRVESGHQAKITQIEWISEAIEQIREKGT